MIVRAKFRELAVYLTGCGPSTSLSLLKGKDMLVLSRRCDAAIQIGRDVKVTVLAIRKHQVQLGIDAPRYIRIWRNELCRGDPRLLEDENENICADEQTQVQKT